MPPEPLVITPPVHTSLISIAGRKKFSWLNECRHLFSRKTLSIFWWPVFKIREQDVLKNEVFKKCNKLPGFRSLWTCIRCGSFAYNSLFLRISPWHRHTILTDILTVALFFGDEFIDGITEVTGKETMRKILASNGNKVYMKKRKWKGNYVVFFPGIIRQIPAEILNTTNSRYGITYREFLELLVQLIELMNRGLARLPKELANETSSKIVRSTNSCLESFFHDVNTGAEIRTPAAVMNFHEQKTAVMISELLELRSVLGGRENISTNINKPGWLDVMRVVQIYDDIQDIVADYNKQDNIVISIAAHYYPEEWQWFIENKNLLLPETHLLYLFTHMPATMEHCQRIASEKIRSMNWEQQKIMHYLIRKATGKLYKKNCPLTRYLNPEVFYQQVKNKLVHLTDTQVRAFVIDCLMQFRDSRKAICRYLTFTEKYMLNYNLMLISPEEKVKILFQLKANPCDNN